MPILPTTAPRTTLYGDLNRKRRRRATSWAASVPIFLRRLFRFPQMDFEFALWQMLYLCIAPRRVYRNIYYHKQTKNQWARDDPAFVVLLSAFLCLAAIAWGLVFSHGLTGILKTMLFMVFVDFVAVGTCVSTICWLLANRFLTHQHTLHAVEQSVEWQYAFDVHCNSFFPLFLMLYVVQFFLMPVLVKQAWICLFLGNTMYLIASSYYCYITFLGYNALPFLLHAEMFLYPISIIFMLYIVSLFNFNITDHVLSLYFGKTHHSGGV